MYDIIYSIFTIKFVPTKTLVANFNLTKKVISTFWKKLVNIVMIAGNFL